MAERAIPKHDLFPLSSIPNQYLIDHELPIYNSNINEQLVMNISSKTNAQTRYIHNNSNERKRYSLYIYI